MHRFCHSSNRIVQYIQLAGNQFSGPMQDRFDEINEFNETGLNNLIAMDLSSNLFTGTIPPSLEGLDAIRVIRLQFNQFNSSVPTGICNIRGQSTLALLEADCGGNQPPNDCNCCTRCCDRETGTCEDEERRLVKVEDLLPTHDVLNVHEWPIPRKRTLQASNECTARYRWDPDTGLLAPYELKQ